MLQRNLHQQVVPALQLSLQLLGGPHALSPEPACIPPLQRPLTAHIPCQLQVSACRAPPGVNSAGHVSVGQRGHASLVSWLHFRPCSPGRLEGFLSCRSGTWK